MANSEPELLYHYTTRQAAFEFILPENRLRLSPFTELGDPLEAKDWLFNATYAPGSSENDRWSETFWRSVSMVNEFKRRTKVVALTADAPQEDEVRPLHETFFRGWARARMWERYGEAHRGICLAFDADRLRERVTQALTKENASQILDGRVEYTVAGLADKGGATTLRLASPDPGDVGPLLSEHFARHGRELFFTKTSEWATEFEHRFAGYTPESTGYSYVDFGDALEKVYLGDQFPPVAIPGAIEFCAALRIEARQMRWEKFLPWDFGVTPLGSVGDLQRNLAEHRKRAALAAATGGSLPAFASRPSRPNT